MEELVLFMMAFLLLLIIYHLFVIKKAKKGDFSKFPTEVNYLKLKYKINVDKSNYKKILRRVAIVSSFDIALIVTIIMMVNHFLLQILAIIVVSPIIFVVSYHLLGKLLQKEGN